MKGKRKIAKGILLLTVAVFIVVALASFDRRDLGSFWKANNLCGPVGAVIAVSLRFILGPVFSWFI
ncbi:MAG: DNA translocase FtsK 4TM domain-containing protein, partial [Candidatus Krumholzibacteria bacterium]|nr:DNA translocase FtsK 4TM domain-containing protein [Candidatus Krumholzibacteria bacterium]